MNAAQFEGLESRLLLTQIYSVTRFDDPAPGSSGISLRQAIISANNDGGGSTIILPASTFKLTRAGRYENLSNIGDLDIRASMTIIGDANGATVIDANGIDRAFDIVMGTAVLKNLFITGGSAGDGVNGSAGSIDGTSGSNGGAI